MMGGGNNQMPGPPSNGMLSHQQPPIHERHQNLAALLSPNSSQKDNTGNMQTSMGNAMHTNYSGPGPGPGPNQYHNTMINNGPPMSSYVSSSYNNTGYMSSASYSTNTNQMFSQTAPTSAGYNSVSSSMPHNMPPMNNGPPNSASMHQQQPSAMHPNQHMHPPVQQHPGAGMMNGPSSVNMMSNNMNRPMPNNAGNPRPTQPMVSIHNDKFFCTCMWDTARISCIFNVPICL